MKFRRTFFRQTVFGQNFGQNIQIRSQFFIFSVKISVKINIRFCSDCAHQVGRGNEEMKIKMKVVPPKAIKKATKRLMMTTR